MHRIHTNQRKPAEIKKALFEMAPMKAPGPDGMTTGFFQEQWGIMGDGIIKAVQSFLHTGQLLRSFNHTNIVLDPKTKSSTQVSQFQPLHAASFIILMLKCKLVV